MTDLRRTQGSGDGAGLGARAMEHIRRLAVDVGPRGSCTEAERRGSEYARAEMERWGSAAEVQPFRCCHTYSLPWGLVGLLMVAAGVLLWLCPPGALIVSALNLVIYGFLASGRGEVGRLFPGRPSQNVWTRIPASVGSGAPRRVVLMAHVDSTRAALLYEPRQLKRLRLTHMVNLVSVIGLLVLPALVVALGGGALGAAPPGPAGTAVLVLRAVGSLLAAVAAYGLGTLVHRELVMPYVAGANDNASGVGVALAVAERLAAEPLERTEVWCVVTGAEESGYPAGSRRFVDAHRDELGDADILVLDNLGAGDLRHLTREGIILPLRMDPGLLALARRLGAARPDWNVRDSACNLGYTDATPVLAAGCRALAVWAEGPDGFLVNYHWPTDVFENVDPVTVDRAATFVLDLVRAVDRDEDRPGGGAAA
ncbi:MAG: M28 family peptidase [Bacillota bacterium]